MKTNKGWIALAVVVCVACGCASVEFSHSPAVAEVKVQAKTDSVEHASPPALDGDTKAATPAAPVEPANGALNLTVEGAIVMALEHNQGLAVEEIAPGIKETFVASQRAVFDPVLVGGYTWTQNRASSDLLVPTQLQGGTNLSFASPAETGARVKSNAGNAGISEHLPTGTDISIGYAPSRTTQHNWANGGGLSAGADTTENASGLQLEITQSLLRGAGLGVNLASLRQAKLSKLSSEYQLRGFVEDLVSQVEQTYWDCLLAKRKIAIFEKSLKVAEEQATEVEERIRVGKLAETERAAAASEVAQRRSSLIDARSALTTTRIRLMRLLNPSEEALRYTEVNLNTEPVMPEISLEYVEESVAVAKRMRPDLNQARLQIEDDELELVKTKNGLLPKLDLFANLGQDLSRTAYAETFQVSREDLRDRNYSTQIGAQFSYPIGNRAARAANTGAHLSRKADLEALRNMTQLAEQDVRTAYVEVGRSQEQIAATVATRKLQEQTLDAETEKFRIGRSTTLLVAQAQRDLLSAQINEVQAQASFLKAIVNLYAVEGSLLERRGVQCPGREPVELEDAPPSPAIHRAG